MSGFTIVVLSYALFTIFIVAFVLRAVRMANQPVHLRWELAPVPHEKRGGRYGGSYLEEYEWWTKPREKALSREAVYMFKEIVFLKGVWEHNRRLWWFSFPFHFGIYLLIGAAALLGLGWVLDLTGAGALGSDVMRTGIPVVAGLGYLLGGIGAIGLIISRLTDRRLKAFATPASVVNLVVPLVVFATGAGALLASNGFTAKIQGLLGALFTADVSVETPAPLAAHLIAALVFLAYLPFTRMMHFVAKYFTYHRVRWDDEPLVAGGRMEKKILNLLGQVPTWSAPHVNADGRKNWVDIATEGPQHEQQSASSGHREETERAVVSGDDGGSRPAATSV